MSHDPYTCALKKPTSSETRKESCPMTTASLPLPTVKPSTQPAGDMGLMHCLNAGGRFFLSHTRLNGMYTIRIAIGNLGSTEQLIQRLWTELEARKDMLTS
jgi:hypothetical protein